MIVQEERSTEMAKSRHKAFTAEFKAQVVLESLAE
jgi:hypothetical protein